MCSDPIAALLHFCSPDPKANILINNNGHACLADFSLLTIISDQQTFLTSCMEGGTTQWMSPELLDPDKFGLKEGRPTKESDCYALGMVIYEVLSGRTPFDQCKGSVVIRKVLAGERPKRPQGNEGKLFTDSIWGVLKLCWKHQPRDRINARAVLLGLEKNPSRSRRLLTRAGIWKWLFGDGRSGTAANNCMISSFHPKLIFNYRVMIGPPIADNGRRIYR
jgi:serine/threonine protein kinase